ncbi:YidC/Oxa1 family insertase periplasmic-domain containing protein, partial [Salmonella enterica subsp. enterica serovar 1,4,[5],12:i:-]
AETGPATAGGDDTVDLPQPTAGNETAAVPESNASTAPARSGDKIEVHTDVLNVRIDPKGGDVTWVSLPAYPRHVDTPDQPFVLMQNDRTHTYLAQS